LDETGILLGLPRTHAGSQPGARVTELKPFYRAAKVTAIGAISINKVLALMTRNDSLDGAAFAVFIEKFLCPQLWVGAVVVMDNLPAHKLASIGPMIQAVGASVICLSPYSPDFNPIEAMVVTTEILFADVCSNYYIHDRSNNCSSPQLNEPSTFKKLVC
jgi:putative transposase